MKNEQHLSHKRYYIFYHDVVAVKRANPDAKIEDTTVKYRKSNGEWSRNFEDAMLWSDFNFAKRKAASLKNTKSGLLPTADVNFVVGEAVITVNPYFSMVVV